MARAPSRWSLIPPDLEAEERLRSDLGTSPLLARLLANRGLREPIAAASFLDASLRRSLRSPMLFTEMARAAGRVLEAVRRRERIAIYGDYDVDGITASTQLLLFLRELGCEPLLHIPHRLRDGYGVRAEALHELADRGARVVITADCGAAAHAEIAAVAGRAVDVVVCDHHQNPAVRPPAFAVLNPVVTDAGFPFAGLCAAGVVFYLLMGTRMMLRESGAAIPDLRRYLDLVALGTVADLVPLLEENRVLVKYGLHEISRSRRAGLRALLEVGGAGPVNVDTLGFRLGPRLNASGRLADATRAVELLACEDEPRARRIAEELDAQNRERRGIEQAMLDEAEGMIAKLEDRDRRNSIVLASEGWHPGVLGIVASRLVERHFRPVVLLAIEGDVARGSARGIPAVHLFEALRSCEDLLERFGGHRMAAGLTLRRERIEDFVDGFERSISSVAAAAAFVPSIAVDDRLGIADVTDATLDDIDRLEPYGQSNPRPLFLAERVAVLSSRIVGEQHLKLALRTQQGRRIVDAIGFRKAELLPEPGSLIDLIFTPELHHWEGRETLQLTIRDLKKSPDKTAA